MTITDLMEVLDTRNIHYEPSEVVRQSVKKNVKSFTNLKAYF